MNGICPEFERGVDAGNGRESVERPYLVGPDVVAGCQIPLPDARPGGFERLAEACAVFDQFKLDLLAPGDVDDRAQIAEQFAVGVENRHSARGEPVHRTVGMDGAILDGGSIDLFDRILDELRGRCPILGMNGIDAELMAERYAAGLESVKPPDLIRPAQGVGFDIPLPDAGLCRIEGVAVAYLAFEQLLLQKLPVGDVDDGADILVETAILVEHRHAARHEPVHRAVGMANPVFEVHLRANAGRLVRALHGFFTVFRMNHPRPEIVGRWFMTSFEAKELPHGLRPYRGLAS